MHVCIHVCVCVCVHRCMHICLHAHAMSLHYMGHWRKADSYQSKLLQWRVMLGYIGHQLNAFDKALSRPVGEHCEVTGGGFSP